MGLKGRGLTGDLIVITYAAAAKNAAAGEKCCCGKKNALERVELWVKMLLLLL